MISGPHLIGNVDLAVYHFLSRFSDNWAISRLVRQEESNNLLKGSAFLAMYWYAWFHTGPDRDARRTKIVSILIGAILAIVVARTVAFVAPFRVRPMYDPAIGHPVYSVAVAADLENWSSFPSDTAAYFFALAFGLAYMLRPLAIPITLYAAVWICLPRIYLGIHYASDVLVGIAIGITTALVLLKNNLIQETIGRRVLAVTETRPEWFYAIAFLVSFEMATVFEEARSGGNFIFHAVLAALRLRPLGSPANHPIDVWGGLLAAIGLLTPILYAISVCYRKLYGVRLVFRLRKNRP